MKSLICFSTFWCILRKLSSLEVISESGYVNAFQEIRSTSVLTFLPESEQVALKIVMRTDGLCYMVSKLRHQVPAYIIGLPNANYCN